MAKAPSPEFVRLFPLPQIVLFPGTIAPLHVFEPRYRDLVAEALGGDRLVALALLAPGYQKDYEGSPAIQPVACLGRIIDHFRLPDGRYNIAVAGLSRVRILEEVPGRTFRRARFEVQPDLRGDAVDAPRIERFLEALHVVVTRAPGALRQMDFVLGDRARPGLVADRAAAALRLDEDTKLPLLAEPDVPRRLELLTADLERLIQQHLVPSLGPWKGPFHFDRN